MTATKKAWIIVALLVPVALLNYLDRQMLAAMSKSMMHDIPDIQTQANWGLVLACFKVVYAVLSPIGGYVADRLSKRHVIAVSLLVWSLVTWITGHVASFNELLIARALMGVSEAFYIPTALALISELHTGPTRSRAVGCHQMGIYAGIILGGFAGHVAEHPSYGWRFAFACCGCFGVLYAVPLLSWLKLAPSGPVPAATEETTSPTSAIPPTKVTPWKAISELFCNPNYILLVLYFTLPAIAGWVVKDWMPKILQDKFDLGQGIAGVSAVLYVNVASLLGVVLGGWLADAGMQRSLRGRIYVSALGMSFFLPALFGVGNAESLAVAIWFLMLFGIGWGFFDCNNMPILCQIVRPELRATGYGFMNLVSISSGAIADYGFGVLRDRKVPLNVIFGVFAGVALLSVVIVLLIRPKASGK